MLDEDRIMYGEVPTIKFRPYKFKVNISEYLIKSLLPDDHYFKFTVKGIPIDCNPPLLYGNPYFDNYAPDRIFYIKCYKTIDDGIEDFKKMTKEYHLERIKKYYGI
jgi:hypothetical protein